MGRTRGTKSILRPHFGIKRNQEKYRRAMAALEFLEQRELLTVDLTGSFLTAPTSALSGSKQPVSVTVVNSGDTAAKGSVTLAFYAELDGVTFDPNTAVALGTLTKSLNIGAAGSVTLNYSLPVSSSLAAGTYRIYSVVDSANKIVETNETNNTMMSAPLTILQPNYDLFPTFDPKATLLPAYLQGVKSNTSVKVVVTNAGTATATIPSGQNVLIEIVARPTGAMNELSDVVLNRSVFKAGVGGLAPGKSRTFTVSIQFPDTLAGADYEIVAKVDTGAALAETDETDNEVSFSHDVKIATAFSDPLITFGSTTVIPLGVVADGRALPLVMDVSNLGNVKIPGGQTCSISIVAHNLGTLADTPLGTFPVTVTGLGSGAHKTFKISPAVALSLANGNYELRGSMTTTVAGDVIGNNTCACDTALTVGPAFYNLSVLTPTSTFNPAVLDHTVVSGTVNVTLKNLSNAILPAGTLVNVKVALRQVGVLNNVDDIVIGTQSNVSVAGLGIGAVKTFHVSSKIPATILGGAPVPDADYEIVATVTPVALVESTLSDNETIGAGTKIAPAFMDLAIVSATQNFHVPSASGSNAIGNVVLRNMGNQSIQATVTVQFFGTPELSITSTLIGSQSFLVTLAPGASTFALSTALTLTVPTNGALATIANVTAKIVQASFTDANSANDMIGAGTVVISSQQVDLKLASVSNPFSGTLNGLSTGSGHATITNIGAGLSSGTVTVGFYASLTNGIDGNSILLGSEDVVVNLNSAQLTGVIDVPLTLPSPSNETVYKILAKITAPLSVDNNLSNNVTTVLGTVTVDPVV